MEVSNFNKDSGIKFLKVVVVEAEKVLTVVGSDVLLWSMTVTTVMAVRPSGQVYLTLEAAG